MTVKIEMFTLHNNRGQSVLSDKLLDWHRIYPDEKGIFGPVERYSWRVNGIFYERDDRMQEVSLRKLPDASGFVCFEKPSLPNNCLLLDAYGNSRQRLTVPWELTRPRNPRSANPPTSFVSISSPFVNPADGKEGEFGITAWVEYAGMYYFEFDYHRGEFLWGLEIRD